MGGLTKTPLFGFESLEDRRLLSVTATLLKDIDPLGDSDPTEFVNVSGVTFFAATDPVDGRELWKSNGTEAGTEQVKDINPAGSSSPGSLTNVDGVLFFSAFTSGNDGANGVELWKSDGTDGGTVQVKDINPDGNSNPINLTNVSGTLFFVANDGTNGYEIWKSDGTNGGTVQVKDINPGGSANPNDLANVDGELFFRANNGANGYELWKSDGTDGGTTMVKDINPAGSSGPNDLTNVDGELFFAANNGANGYELWKSDGTDGGTTMVKDINPGSDSSSPFHLTNVSGELFFAANDGTNGAELWKSDGTEGGTVQVKDINPAAGVSSNPNYLTNVSGGLFFAANDGTNGTELWKSNGTEGGTVQVKNINPAAGVGSSPTFLTNVSGELFFRANDGSNGNELWHSDGTDGGTLQVSNANPPPSRVSNPTDLANSNGRLYFATDADTNGTQPWIAPEHTVVTVDGDQDFPNQPDTFLIERDAGDPSIVNIFRNGALFGAFALDDLWQININGLGGNDSLIVNAGNGLITVPGGILYDGGDGFDNLKLLGGNPQSEVLAVGALPGSGKDTQTSNGDVQVVDFENIEPIVSGGVQGNFDITGIAGLASLLQEANAINYIQSEVDAGLGVDATWGKVTVDNFEPIYFQNKTNLTIDAGAGSDEINLNNPSTPTGLQNIAISGSDPTASDTLIVNGTANDNTVTYTPLAAQSVVTVNGLPTISFTTVEHLIVNGQAANDDLIIDTTAIGGTLVLSPGVTFDSGRVDFQINTGGNFLPTPIEFLGLGTTGLLVVNNSGEQVDNVDFVYRGTDLSDVFTVSQDNGSAQIDLNNQIPVFLTNVTELTLAGLNGNDLFNLPAVVTLDRVVLDGGNPDGGSDELNYFAEPDTTTTIDFDLFNTTVIDSSAATTPQVFSDGVETVNLLGSDGSLDAYVVDNYGAPTDVKTLNLDTGDTEGNDDVDTIRINTTDGPDSINYTPLSTESARVTRSEGGPQINILEFNNGDGNLVVNNPGNVDVMKVLASGSADTIDVLQVAEDATRATVNALNAVKWVPVDFIAFNGLSVYGNLGDDTLVVDNSGGLITLPSGITYDGGSGDDELQLVGDNQIDIAIYTVGQNPGEGVVIHEANIVREEGEVNPLTELDLVQKVFFKNLEPVIDTVIANSLTINATNGDNAINYIEGPNSTQNVPTGLVSVDNFETYEFANKTNLIINALAGSDEINLNNPTTPTGLQSIGINGDDPTASDTLIVNGTPAGNDIEYTPLGADAGVVTVDALPTIAFDTVEHLIVNGQGGNDDLILDTSQIGGRLVLTPGASFDEGRVDFQTNPASDFIAPSLEFLGLGNGLLLVDNEEGATVDFVYRGTDLSDVFTVSDDGTEATVLLNAQIPVILLDVSVLTMAGLDGDDEFNVPVITVLDEIILDGGNPGAGSDVLNYMAALDTESAIDFATSQITSDVTDAAPVTFGGIETINMIATDGQGTDEFAVLNYGLPTGVHTLNLDAGDVDGDDADRIDIFTTDSPDTLNFIPMSTSSARITRSQGGPQINISQFNNADGNLVVNNRGNVDALNVFGSETTDTIDVIQAAADTPRVTVNVGSTPNAVKWVPIQYNGLASLKILGQLGNDTLVVDNSNGLVDLAGGITYDGGDDFDALQLTGTTEVDSTEYTVGPEPGSGSVTHTIDDPLMVQQVFFSNLEPFTDDVIAIATIINGTNAANAINYVQSEVDAGLGVDGTWGKVTVDGFEPNYFKNKAFVTINGLAGSDEISLNNPSTPTGLTQININGNDPTASDTLIVNGTVAAENIVYRPNGDDSGTVAVGALPIIVFDTVEHLTIRGQGGPDGLTIDTSAIDARLVLTPGSAFDSGRIDFQTNPSGGFISPSVDFLAIGPGGGIEIQNVDAELPNVDFVYRGTDLSDVFSATPTGLGTNVNLNDQLTVLLRDVGDLTLAGLDGSDEFNTQPLPMLDNVFLDGGNPDGGSDVLNYSATPATTTTVSFPTVEVTSSVADAAPVAFDGVEIINVLGTDDAVDDFIVLRYGTPTDVLTVNLDGGDGNNDDGDTFEVNTTTGPDTIVYTPMSAASARINREEGGPEINILQFNNADDNLSLTNPGNVDALQVEGSESGDTIEVIRSPLNGTRVTVTAGNVNKWVPIEYRGLNSLVVNGNLGDDTLDVDNSAGLITLEGGTTFDGGSGNDLLRLIGSTAIDTATYWVGQQPDAGRVIHELDDGEVLRVQKVFFSDVEPAIDIVIAATLTVNATNADNAINYIVGPNSNQAPVGNVPSGLVSVDGFETMEFANKTQLVINALAGSDEIQTNNPTVPNALTGIVVNGGDPTASDTLIVNGTPAGEEITYRPDSADSGRVEVENLPIVSFDTVEHVKVNGQLGSDNLIVDTSELEGVLVLNPGSAFDRGQIDFRTNPSGTTFIAPSLEYLGLGEGGDLEIVNADGELENVDFLYRGTDASDLFEQVDVTINLNSQIPVILTDVENLTLEGLAGDDTFVLNATVPFNEVLVDGGEPDASDVLNLVGTAGDDVVEIFLFSGVLPATLPTIGGVPVDVAVLGLGAPIGVKGVEGVNVDGNGGNDTLSATGTEEDDTFTYTPTHVDNTPDDGIFTNAAFNEVFSFNNITGDFTIDGGGAFELADQVIVRGTNGPDFIDVDSPNRTVTVDDPGGTSLKPVVLGDDIEIASVEARGGNDTILVTPAPATQTGPGGAPAGTNVPLNLLINVDGGGPSASDALVVADAGGAALPASDFVVINRSRRPDEGVVRIYRDGTALPDITYVDTEIVSPILPPPANPVQDPPLMILGPDLFEQNEFLSTAAFLGSGSTINVHDLAIFPNAFEHRFVPADQDWFRVVAQTTGTLDFQAYFRVFASAGAASIPGGGNLNIEAYDAEGNLITGFGTNDTTADARVRIPAVAGQTYYVRIFGAEDDVFNGYDMTVINEATPVPFGLELYDVIVAADVAAGVSTTVFTSTSTDLSQENDFYNGKYIHFKSGDANGLRGLIEDYAFAAATGTFTLAAPLAVTPQEIGEPPVEVIPAAGDVFEIESNDTGRSQNDNVTRDDTPLIFLRLDDGIFLHDLPGNPADDSPPDEVIPIPFQDQTQAPGYRIAIFDEGDVPPQESDPPQDPVGFATAVAGQEGVYFFEFTEPLSMGSHFLTARVQIIDPADPEQTGFGPRSLTFEIFVDVQTPPVFFGLPFLPDDGLDPGSDTGVIGMPETFNDGITSDTTPTFFGTAEADTVVRLFADLNDNGTLEPTDILIGQTVATPIDGTNQFPGGRWEVRSNVDLNDPSFFPLDGLRTIFVTAEDVAGNQGPAEVEALQLFIDTQGPQVTELFITNVPEFNLFGLKPDNAPEGPTPLIFSLTVNLQDLPPRVAGFLYDAIKAETAETPGVIVLVGDHNGIIEIDDIIVTNLPPVEGQPALATIELIFDTPLPDDRFTLTLNDTIRDLAGNKLDGETDASEPTGQPFIPPSGDGQPGGDFVARFTVDSRPEVGTYAAANIFIDANGNFLADFQGKDNDFTNRDLNFALGIVPSLEGTVSPMNIHDSVFAGNFPRQTNNEDDNEVNGLAADGYDKLAAYGFDNLIGKFRWLIDVNSDGVINPADGDHATIQPNGFEINGLPVAGDFDGNAANGDEIGLFDGRTWFFDTNHNYVIDGGDLTVNSNLRGMPIAGDFNGDGIEDLGTWRDDQFEFNFGTAGPNWNGQVQATIQWGLPGGAELPVAADMDQDGITDIGLYLPSRTGTLPLESGNWQFLISNDFGQNQRGGNQVNALDHPFSPRPLGDDIFAQFGDAFALPLVGNFDPPVATPQLPTPEAIGPVLGSVTMGTQAVDGESWYEFQPLRSGTVTVEASSSAGNVGANLYSEDFTPMSSVDAQSDNDGGSSASVVAGNTYLVRLSGTDAPATMTITNDVPLADRADTSRDGRVSPQDVLFVINDLLVFGSHATPMDMSNATMYLDASLDGRISPHDVLTVINHLLVSRQASSSPSAAPAAAPSAAPAAAPAAEPAAKSASGDSDGSQAAVATALAMSASSPAASTLLIAPGAADAVYTELSTAPTATVAIAADVAWSDFEADALADDEPADFELDIDWGLDDE